MISKIPSWVFGLAAGAIALIVVLPLQGAATCEDGSSSSSIGRSGACSHHGGVDRPFPWPFLFAVGTGIWVGTKISSRRGQAKNDAKFRASVARPAEPTSTKGRATPAESAVNEDLVAKTAEGEANTKAYLARYFASNHRRVTEKRPPPKF